MPIKIVTASTKFCIYTDDQGKIITISDPFKKFIGQPLYVFENFLYSQKIQKVTIEDIEEE